MYFDIKLKSGLKDPKFAFSPINSFRGLLWNLTTLLYQFQRHMQADFIPLSHIIHSFEITSSLEMCIENILKKTVNAKNIRLVFSQSNPYTESKSNIQTI